MTEIRKKRLEFRRKNEDYYKKYYPEIMLKTNQNKISGKILKENEKIDLKRYDEIKIRKKRTLENDNTEKIKVKVTKGGRIKIGKNVEIKLSNQDRIIEILNEYKISPEEIKKVIEKLNYINKIQK